MVKERSQKLIVSIKKEEDHKDTLLLNSSSSTTKSRNKIAKRKELKNSILSLSRVKLEEETKSETFLKALPKYKKRKAVTEEQIKQLIGYINNDNMSMTAASRKVKMSSSTGKMYYAIYKNDPEKKTPLPINQSGMFKSECTQEQIATLIKCKTDDNMSLTFVSVKANMHPLTGINYHLQYMSNPDRKIPAPNNNTRKYGRRCTKDQVKALIGYIINDSMKIHAAAIKTGMSKATAKRYYAKYLNDPNHNIPDPKGKANGATVACTKKRIKELIDYIIHGKISLLAASIKTNICESTARKYYLKYLNDPNHEIPSSSVKSRCIGGIACTQEQVKGLIDYIVNEKMSIQAAAVKANMSEPTARKYYLEYLNDPNRDIPIPKRKMQDKIKQLIGYIVNDKMSICAASKEVNISYPTALKYYHQYLHDLDYKIPDPNEKINNIKQKHLPTKK